MEILGRMIMKTEGRQLSGFVVSGAIRGVMEVPRVVDCYH